MAGDTDDSQKTEDPSSRKLQRARSKGQVAQSREVNTWFMLAAGTGIVLFFAPPIALRLRDVLVRFIDVGYFLGGGEIGWSAVGATLAEVGMLLVLPVAVAIAAAFAGSLVQTGLIFATDKIGFKLENVSPLSGLRRLFSIRALVDFLKGLFKVAIVAALAGWMLLPMLDRLPEITSAAIEDLMPEIHRLILRLSFAVLAVMSVVAMADYVFQRMSFIRSMRMSKQEVKEEHKQSEGDPAVKGRLRQIRVERARKRMMAAVPGASVVVTNPTHYAVALKYEMGAAGAPRLVAKGTDLVAQRIREIARENDVPIVENPPLARALHAGVELDREIPPEHYKAVAEIIGYVFRLKGRFRQP